MEWRTAEDERRYFDDLRRYGRAISVEKDGYQVHLPLNEFPAPPEGKET